MKNVFAFLAIGLITGFFVPTLKAQDNSSFPPGYQVDTRIDNMGYWRKCAKLGLVTVEPFSRIPQTTYTGTNVLIDGILVADSPDIPVTTESVEESENSIFVDMTNNAHVLNSNNSGPWPPVSSFYGANYFHSFDKGLTWSGSVQGIGGSNGGDPAACINMNGRYFIGFINSGSGQSVACSDNNGSTWSIVPVANGSGMNGLDKNHLWVDNSPTSPFQGYLYDGWMKSNNMYVSRSITNGSTWEPNINISLGTAAGDNNQGINLNTGPEGEAYATWVVYDTWQSDEVAIGFAKSLDGGITWQPAFRALNNIQGIRTSGVSQHQRVNSFPSMAVDISNSLYRGTIYIVWPNKGVPGINNDQGCDVYLIKSTDEGNTWSTPIRINKDPAGQGKFHYFPWITCDQANGQLSIVYYDNRNVPYNQCEAWMAWSEDGGATWGEMKVSDVAWTPSPVPGASADYFGDYLGITAFDKKVYPCWTDNRMGYPMTFVSPIDLYIPVSQVVSDGNILNDTTFGNGNGIMDFGETILLGLKMINHGDLATDSINVTLSTDSPYITFEDSTEYYGNFNTGQSKTIPDAFKFDVSDYIPTGHNVTFQVTASNALDSVTVSFFMIQAQAPAVTILGISIDDATGNNNNRLDPGESAIVKFQTKNTGRYNAVGVVSTLESSNPFVKIEDPIIQLGTLAPGQSVYSSFQVFVNSNIPRGAATVFRNLAEWQTGMDTIYKLTDIGMITEDWETANFHNLLWQSSGDTSWVIDPTVKWEGNYSARSGNISIGKTSELLISYNALFDDSLSFYRKIYSEQGKDRLLFYIDGLLVGIWSGNSDFIKVSYPVLAGLHIFKWIYEKAASSTQNLDHAWIDNIVFPPEYQTAASAGDDACSWAGSAYQLMSAAYCYDSIRWTTSGNGTFNDPALYNPLYTPGQDDILNGNAVLTITAYGQDSIISSDEMILTVFPGPVVELGQDTAICAHLSFNLDATTAGATGYQWFPGGQTNPVIIVDSTGIGIGTCVFSVVVSTSLGCVKKDSVQIIFKDCTGMNELARNLRISVYPNPTPGAFTLNIVSLKPETISLKMINLEGETVYEKCAIEVNGELNLEVAAGHLPQAGYLLEVSNKTGTLYTNVIIRK